MRFHDVRFRCVALILFTVAIPRPLVSAAAEGGAKAADAVVKVRTAQRSPHPIPRLITGKFCEHLGSNIYHGMDAQIVRNPTLADWPFNSGSTTPDGIVAFLSDRQQIGEQLRKQARRLGWPEARIEQLLEDRNDGLACWWIREGRRDDVQVSPDTGPQGGRAQRLEVKQPGQGIAQYVYLPLDRVRKYEVRLLARSPEVTSLSVSLAPHRTSEGDSPISVERKSEQSPHDAQAPAAKAAIPGLSSQWKWLEATLELPAEAPADAVYRLTLTCDAPGQLVIARFFLRPADHVKGADPEVVRLLKESRLPILRWPGGNFVSGYHWEDGIGPIDARPTRPNYAWGGVEPNLFGTDEFIAFCRAVGCEPMICINAGDGTPDEAARWIEYCNGPADSPMGRRRAAAGQTEPHRVRHWEVGNELWGRWQVGWSTAAGYADRYEQFARKMQAADPSITLYACGAPVLWGKGWNDTLIRRTASILRTVTDHPLIGGQVSPAGDPLEVYRDFMLVPDLLEKRWAELRGDMEAAGIKEPRLAITELQLFARIGPAGKDAARLMPENLVNPATQAEGLYDVLIYHRAVRLAPFVDMVTHSATVNHGGGLRKERERVYANPCHWAQAMFAELSGAVPVAVEVQSPKEKPAGVLGSLGGVPLPSDYDALDALAAVAPDGDLLLSLVHRGAASPLRVRIELADFPAGRKVEVRTLSADVPWAANTRESPQSVLPKDSTAETAAGKLELEIRPFTLMRLRVPKAR